MNINKSRPNVFYKDTEFVPMHTFNTGTIFDLIVGRAIKGIGDKWYITGGLSNHITGLYGINNCFKSTLIDGLVGRCAAIYDADVVIFDTEGSKDDTLGDFQRRTGEMSDKLDMSTVTFKSGMRASLQAIMDQIMEAGQIKEQNKKEFLVDTPFPDMMTGKPQKAWIPTIIYIDSFSEAWSDTEDELFSVNKMEGKKSKTWAMVDGGEKTKFIRLARKYCEKYGLILVMTAHSGTNINMDNSYLSPAKKSQHMKQNEALKNVGSKFYTLTKTLVNVHSPSVLIDAKKEAEYQMGDTPPMDINQVLLKTIRCKSNISGPSFPLVFSQHRGFLNDVTYYHYLRQCGYRGLVGNKVTHAPAFKPDDKITRNSFRQKSNDDYEFRRAVELTGQMVFLQNYWLPIPELMPAWSMDPENFWNELSKKHSDKVSDILNSRNYWSFKKEEREYMSIFDVLELMKKGK